jgi:signal transduction histidine kinase
MQEALTVKNIILQCSIDPESLEITADSDMIEQVLINLIYNAIDALSETSNPHILLRAFLNDQGRPCIQVEDNGRGILEEVQLKIFIPFFSTKKGGTGIGLSLSRQILRMHGGTIRVQSGIDKGTIFTLRF